MKNLGLLLGLVNTIAIAAVLGLFVYTQLIFKRPAITEGKERRKLVELHAKPKANDFKKVIVNLEPITSNLDPFQDTDGKSKLHYVSMKLAVELRDQSDQEKFEKFKAVLMDKVLQNLSKKRFEDLNQVQGRYIFRSQIIDAANQFMQQPIITEIYFSDFVLQ